MTRLTITILLVTIFKVVFGQDTFEYHRDFKIFLELSKDSTSAYYYPLLLDRFNKNDTTLTSIEVLVLQTGFTSNPYYKPYQTVETEREIRELNQSEKI